MKEEEDFLLLVSTPTKCVSHFSFFFFWHLFFKIPPGSWHWKGHFWHLGFFFNHLFFIIVQVTHTHALILLGNALHIDSPPLKCQDLPIHHHRSQRKLPPFSQATPYYPEREGEGKAQWITVSHSGQFSPCAAIIYLLSVYIVTKAEGWEDRRNPPS